MWWLAGLAGCGIVLALWWIVYHVGWRDAPGRHSVGYVDEVEETSHDDGYPYDGWPTDVLPMVQDELSHMSYYDPSFYRLSRAVRAWVEATNNSQAL